MRAPHELALAVTLTIAGKARPPSPMPVWATVESAPEPAAVAPAAAAPVIF